MAVSTSTPVFYSRDEDPKENRVYDARLQGNLPPPPCLFRFPPSIAASTNPPICIVEWRHFSDSAHRSQKARDFANLSRRPLQVAFPIVQAVIHEPLDLHRSTIYCPLNLTRSSGRISLVEKRNFESIEKKKENLLGEKRGSFHPSMDGERGGILRERIRSFYSTAKCWHTSRSTIPVTKTLSFPPPLPTREILPGLFDFLADMKRSRAKLRFTLFTDRSDPTYPSKGCIHS